MCRIGDACKQGMVSLFSYLPESEKLLTKTTTNGKTRPIFPIISLPKRELNSEQNLYNTFHHTMSKLSHYFGKVSSSLQITRRVETV